MAQFRTGAFQTGKQWLADPRVAEAQAWQQLAQQRQQQSLQAAQQRQAAEASSSAGMLELARMLSGDRRVDRQITSQEKIAAGSQAGQQERAAWQETLRLMAEQQRQAEKQQREGIRQEEIVDKALSGTGPIGKFLGGEGIDSKRVSGDYRKTIDKLDNPKDVAALAKAVIEARSPEDVARSLVVGKDGKPSAKLVKPETMSDAVRLQQEIPMAALRSNAIWLAGKDGVKLSDEDFELTGGLTPEAQARYKIATSYLSRAQGMFPDSSVQGPQPSAPPPDPGWWDKAVSGPFGFYSMIPGMSSPETMDERMIGRSMVEGTKARLGMPSQQMLPGSPRKAARTTGPNQGMEGLLEALRKMIMDDGPRRPEF